MSFKLSNNVFDQSVRAEKTKIRYRERITGTGTLNPYIPTTEVVTPNNEQGTYIVTLPNALPGTTKIVTVVQNNGSTVTIEYNSGYGGGGSNDITLGTSGDTIIFWASNFGWHYRSYID